MRRVILIGAILAVSACVASAQTPIDPTPTTRPVTTTRPTPTSPTTIAATTTAVDVERASLYRVDPGTLDPLPGVSVIPAGDSIWATTSSDGAWMALVAIHDGPNDRRLRLIDMAQWETTTDLHHPWFDVHLVDDRGQAYWFESGTLKSIGPGEDEAIRTSTELPSWFTARDVHFRDPDHFALFGTRSVGAQGGQVAMLALGDLTTGDVDLIELDEVDIGSSVEVEVDDYLLSVPTSPATVWDETNDRLLVAHADTDRITEVDLTDGLVVVHDLRQAESGLGHLLAWIIPPAQAKGPYYETGAYAALSPDGQYLYTGAQRGEVQIDNNGDWTTVSTSTGLQKVDTATWDVVDRLDAPVAQLALSPDGTRLLATGFSSTVTDSSSDRTSSGLFIIDTAGMGVIAHHDPATPDEEHSGFSFSGDSAYGYETTTVDGMRAQVVDLSNGRLVAERRAAEIHVFGQVGVLGVAEAGN